MALSYKTRRRLSLLVLLVGLPVYIVLALNIVALFERPSFLVEIVVYVGLGIVWALPLRAVFRGIGQPDPDRGDDDRENVGRENVDRRNGGGPPD